MRRDLFDAYEPFFEDKAKALDAQITWAKARAKRIEETGKRAFAHVITGSSHYFSTYDYSKYESTGGQDKDAGTVLYINTSTGKLEEEKGVKLKAKMADAVASDGTPAPSQREMPDSAYLEAHLIRAKVARAAIVGDKHLTLALTVWGLVLGNDGDLGRVAVGQLAGTGAKELIPEELQLQQDALHQMLLDTPGLSRESKHTYISAFGRSGVQADRHKLLELLVSMTDDELLGHLNTLTALVAYNWSGYSNKVELAPEYTYLAHLTGAPQRLAESFTLTDEHLRRYPRHELVALAEEAGLGRALVEDCSTLKEMRARILEHAERLHTEGFVPALVRFPETTG